MFRTFTIQYKVMWNSSTRAKFSPCLCALTKYIDGCAVVATYAVLLYGIADIGIVESEVKYIRTSISA